MTEATGVVVTLDEIYKQVQATDDKVDKLAAAVGDMVAINRRLDQHHDRLNDHGSRLGTVETQQAIAAATIAATAKPKATWYQILGGVGVILTGLVSIVLLITYLGKISSALGG